MKARMLAALCGIASLVACAPSASEPVTADLVARGAYLVTGIGGCNDCHTQMSSTGPDMARTLQGAELAFAPLIEVPWASYAPPLAGGPTNYTDAEFASFLQTGIRPDGSAARAPMPAFRFSKDDAHAVVAYIKTLPAADGSGAVPIVSEADTSAPGQPRR